MKRLPPLGPIQAFVAVARLGSVRAAAEALALSSPALTRRIQSLEQFVGRPLFERQHNAVQLNAAGERLLAEVAPHLDALLRAIEKASEPGKGMRLRIAVPSLFAAQRLMPALPSLHERHPNLQIDLDTGANRLSRIGDGLDAAIAIAERVDGGLYSRMIERTRIVAIGSRKFTQGRQALTRPADIARVPILLHKDMPDAFDAWGRAVGLPKLHPAAVSTFDAGQLILDAAAEGLGVAFMLEGHLAASPDDRLVQVFAETADSPYHYWFACTPAALERRPVKAFHDWLFDRFAPAEAA
jgi:LysR family glycine cleavage system transcriptional activator